MIRPDLFVSEVTASDRQGGEDTSTKDESRASSAKIASTTTIVLFAADGALLLVLGS